MSIWDPPGWGIRSQPYSVKVISPCSVRFDVGAYTTHVPLPLQHACCQTSLPHNTGTSSTIWWTRVMGLVWFAYLVSCVDIDWLRQVFYVVVMYVGCLIVETASQGPTRTEVSAVIKPLRLRRNWWLRQTSVQLASQVIQQQVLMLKTK